MNPVTNRSRDNHSISICPVSGLTILQKPEWQEVNLGEGYKITISRLGDNILYLQPSGYATLKVIEKFVSLISKVLANNDDSERPYIQLEDYARLKGASLEARKYYIDYLLSQERLSGLVFFNVSPILKLSIKLGRQLKKIHFSVKIVDNYDSAVRTAQALLADRQIKSGAGHESVDSAPFKISPEKNAPQKVAHHPDWHLQFANFSLRFEVINDKVLHGISTGRLEKSHIEPSLQLQEEVTRSAGLSAGKYYYILGLKDSAGTSQKARKQYVNAILRLYKKNPFRMFVFYGANRLIKAGINLAKPFIPFRVGIVDNIDLALALVAEDEAKNLSQGNFSDADDSIVKPCTPKTLQQYVDELLQFLEEINWESDIINHEKERDPSHPFSPVFDAIELIKWEFDDLIRERKQSEEAIRRAKTLAEKANNAKSEFLANMSHELRTPLNHIIGFTELVMDKNFGELNATQEEYLGDVIHSSKHLLALINDILDLSKVEAGKHELELSIFNPARLLENSVVRGRALACPCAGISLIFTVVKFGRRAKGSAMGPHFISSFP